MHARPSLQNGCKVPLGLLLLRLPLLLLPLPAAVAAAGAPDAPDATARRRAVASPAAACSAHLQALLTIIAQFAGDHIPCELRLLEPLELDLPWRRQMRNGEARRQTADGGRRGRRMR